MEWIAISFFRESSQLRDQLASPESLALQADSLPSKPSVKPCLLTVVYINFYAIIIIIQSVEFSHLIVSNSLQHLDCSMPGFLSITNSWSLLKLMPIKSVIPSNHLILCHPLLLPPSISPRGVYSLAKPADRVTWAAPGTFAPTGEQGVRCTGRCQ